MDRLRLLRSFVRIVELGSFSRASVEAGCSQSYLSRAVRDLEAELELQLLQRTTRSVTLTPEGELYLVHVREALASLAIGEDVARSKGPSGVLRITAPLGYGRHCVAPVVREYLRTHRGARAELVLTDRWVDLVEERFDLAIRVGDLPSSTLRAQRVGENPTVVVAHPSYLDHAPPLETPRDLHGHSMLVFDSMQSDSTIRLRREGRTRSVRIQARFRSNALSCLYDALHDALGVAVVPRWLVRDDVERGALCEMLSGWATRPLPIHAVLPPGRHVPSRSRLFLEALTTTQPTV